MSNDNWGWGNDDQEDTNGGGFAGLDFLDDDPFEVSSWEADASAFQAIQAPTSNATSAAAQTTRPNAAIQKIRSKVFAMSAMKAFSGFVQSINKVTETTALSTTAEDGAAAQSNSSQPSGQLTGEAMLRRASDLLREQRKDDSLDIDAMLAQREAEGEAVLSPLSGVESEWSIPDLTLIFRPPASLMEAMAVGVSPGKWVKIAPDNIGNLMTSKWSVLKSVVSTGMGLQASARESKMIPEEEFARRKTQVAFEVDQLKSFLLSITHAWEQLMSEEVKALPFTPDPWPMPTRGPFQVKAIATGICQIFPDVEWHESMLIDIDVLATYCQPAQNPGNTDAACAITEVCGRACPKGGMTKDHDKPAPKKSGANRLSNVCAFKMRLSGGGDNVTLRIWSNGKTQTSGCKDAKMLLEANTCISDAIRQIYNTSRARQDIPPIFIQGDEFAKAALSCPRKVKILSAPILGSWDMNLRAVNAKLNMEKLCEYLTTDTFSDRVFKVKDVKPKGNSARFNNLSLYIKREALKSWVEDGSDQTTVYVNVYEAGKCSVLAAPDANVAEELAEVVSQMLLDAYQQDHIRVDVEPDQKNKRQKTH